MRRPVARFHGCFTLLLSALAASGQAAIAPEGPLGKAGSQLRELAVAPDPASFARSRALSLRAGPLGPECRLVIETTGDAALERGELEALGAELVQTHGSRASAWLPLARLGAVASHPRVLALSRPVPPTWDAVSQGVALTGASSMHQRGYRGQNVRIGVIDVFQGYRSRIGVELPPAERVTFRSFLSGGGEGDDEHGVNVAEILTDMAPDAHLYLAAIDDDIAYANAIDWLRGQGVDIINHSGGFGLLGDLRGDGPVHGKIAEAFAGNVLYVEAAGNYGRSHWEGSFRDGNRNGSHEFAPGVETIFFEVDEDRRSLRIDLSWDDWVPTASNPRPTTDYDLCLYDSGGVELACARDGQSGQPGQFPYELLSFEVSRAGRYGVGVQRISGRDLHFEVAVIPSYDLESFAMPASSLIAPADSPFALTVGATSLQDLLRAYSSRGPANDGRLKPELTAPDGVQLSTGSFFGTSAATPHVAGAAALLLSLDPNLGAGSLRDRLISSALALPGDPVPGPDNSYGFGRLNADFGGGTGPAPTPRPPAGGGGSGGGGGCRLVAPGDPFASVELYGLIVTVLVYGAWLARRR